MTGPIPPELGNLASLRHLVLRDNTLSGPIPPALGDIDGLRVLVAGGNQLTGSIPPELGNLRNLRGLILGGNRLTGSIPPEFGNLPDLQTLILSWNDLTGPIPPELGSLGLTLLWLNNSAYSGRLPTELVGMPLASFYWRLTGLCAPLDAAFQEWLRRIPQRGGPNCSS